MKCSPSIVKYFVINENQQADPIVAYEYWLDEDSIVNHKVQKTNVLEISDEEVVLENLKSGVHTMYLRVRTESGVLSATVSNKFLGGSVLDVILPWGSDWPWESKYIFTDNRDNYADPAAEDYSFYHHDTTTTPSYTDL